MDPVTARTWRVDTYTCLACEVLEATIRNDVDAGRIHGRKYAVSRAT